MRFCGSDSYSRVSMISSASLLTKPMALEEPGCFAPSECQICRGSSGGEAWPHPMDSASKLFCSKAAERSARSTPLREHWTPISFNAVEIYSQIDFVVGFFTK